MNDRFARRAFAVAVISVAIMVGATISFVVNECNVPRSADPAFAPTIIAVPEHFQRKLVLRFTKDADPTEHDGCELYRESFVSGWEDCADAFVADWKRGEESYWSYEPEDDSSFDVPWLIQAPDEINDARRDGWRLCREEIQALLKTRSESQVRAMLGE